MRTKFLFTIVLAASSVAFAQKKEVKELEKAIKSGSYAQAKTLIAPAEALAGEMDEKTQQKFTLLKAQAYLGLDNRNIEDLDKAATAFSSLEGTKYHQDAVNGISSVVSSLVNGAVDDQNGQKYSKAASKLEKAYNFSKKDTVYLYFAASNAVNGKDYETALKSYSKLQELNYSGSELGYYATNVETGEEELLSNKNERDLSVIAKTHIKPIEKYSEPKSAEIAKNIALIYVSQGKNEEALGAMAAARKENPNDIALLKSEADIYLEMNLMDKYEELIIQVIEKDPNNPGLFYNLGVGADKKGDPGKAMEYYKKAIELKPDHPQANQNIAGLILGEEKTIIDEMNSLGDSNSDYAKYEKLKIKRENLYKEAIPYLEKSMESKATLPVGESLYGIYQQLNMTSKADAMKARIETIEEGAEN